MKRFFENYFDFERHNTHWPFAFMRHERDYHCNPTGVIEVLTIHKLSWWVINPPKWLRKLAR